ncbi:sigma-70 family RNA polymerase sigma factor [Nonomuraea aurantiaca]|uniref:sigma-70 family RNA polymerase sigma factor n=1 Tax=Nonomuraea aurantiaca TaxID=2878562 RepID=UPI001CD9837B|nr:sigma-70 family RNA polymerase sigma factor [Nonomuraea aurantiaca]MCA2221018.1 sigma-70 family RNA polymerase sigma factor [Nonomuraea aurantiaca]
MEETEWLAERFEQHRPRLRAAAYRLLGSMAEADDAVQDAWLRLCRSDTDQIDNLGGWLTTVVARECLHMLRSRRQRPAESRLPEPVVIMDSDLDPEQEALLADSVGLALLVVLDRLSPAERLAFVLHDMFELPFDEIAGIVGRTPAAARQLASRARRRVNGAEIPSPDPDLARQRQVVDAFYAASRAGDFEALVQILDPDVVLTSDFRVDGQRVVVRGAAAVARHARGPRGGRLRPVLVNGVVGALITIDDQPFAVLVFTVSGDRIVAIDGLRDPERVRQFADAAGIAPPPVTSPVREGS